MIELVNNSLKEVSSSLCLYMRSGLTAALAKSLVELQDKGVVVELLIESENAHFLTQDPTVLHQLTRLVQAGGILQKVTCLEPVNAFYLTDFRTIHFISPSNVHTKFNEFQHRDYLIKTRKYIEGLKQKATQLLVDISGIQSKFSVTPEFVKAGDEVEVSWEVKGTDEVEIEGIGKVESRGKIKKIFFDNTILKLKAKSQKYYHTTCTYLRVYGDVEIHYDLGFLNTLNEQFSSLINDANYQDVFGVMKGHTVQLNWEVHEAEKVKIDVFGLSQKRGTHTFLPEKSMEIKIEAWGNGQYSERTIQLNVFPIPVFTDRLVKLNPSFLLKELKVKVPNHDARMQQPEMKSLANEAELRYKELNKRAKEIMSLYQDDISPESLETSMFTEISKRYSLKQEVKRYIDDLFLQLKSVRKST